MLATVKWTRQRLMSLHLSPYPAQERGFAKTMRNHGNTLQAGGPILCCLVLFPNQFEKMEEVFGLSFFGPALSADWVPIVSMAQTLSLLLGWIARLTLPLLRAGLSVVVKSIRSGVTLRTWLPYRISGSLIAKQGE